MARDRSGAAGVLYFPFSFFFHNVVSSRLVSCRVVSCRVLMTCRVLVRRWWYTRVSSRDALSFVAVWSYSGGLAPSGRRLGFFFFWFFGSSIHDEERPDEPARGDLLAAREVDAVRPAAEPRRSDVAQVDDRLAQPRRRARAGGGRRGRSPIERPARAPGRLLLRERRLRLREAYLGRGRVRVAHPGAGVAPVHPGLRRDRGAGLDRAHVRGRESEVRWLARACARVSGRGRVSWSRPRFSERVSWFVMTKTIERAEKKRSLARLNSSSAPTAARRPPRTRTPSR